MQKIARELKNSETAFIFTPTQKNNSYDIEVRFFTPVAEVPILRARHNSSTFFVRAMDHAGPAEQNSLQKTKAGILPIGISRTTDGIEVKMTQGEISFRAIERSNRLKILNAIGLNENDLLENCPVEIVSTGHSKVIIGIRSRVKLIQLAPNPAALTEISKLTNCNGYFVFTFEFD